MLDLNRLKQDLKTEALRLGFSHFGVAAALPVPDYDHFVDWLRQGYHGEMGYLSRKDTVQKRGNPQLILDNCQRVICLALPYGHPKASISYAPTGKGRIAAYALTEDYHEVLWDKLAQLEDFLREKAGDDIGLKSYADTGPILERSYATAAGIGIAGKNTCLLIQGAGSYHFLAETLTTLPLPVDAPYTRDLCGACTRCIDACPTSCILPDRTLDATRCISYLTIENKGVIPADLKSLVGDWVFGCDVCQMVCPHNARPSNRPRSLGEPCLPAEMALISLFELDEPAYKEKFGPTALSRAKRTGILRNAAVVLGNQRASDALPLLRQTLETETDPGVRDACRWAIEQISQDRSAGREGLAS